MLKNIFLCLALSKFNCKHRGAAMTEYAILLAFIAAVAVAVFYADWYDVVPDKETGLIKGHSLFGAIYASIMNAVSALDPKFFN